MRPSKARLSLPGSDELNYESLLSRFDGSAGTKIELLGHSRTGRRIPLVTVGEGSRSVLVVGAPHPNEPTGCLTILRLLAELTTHPELSETPDWQWHFIPAIDLDGIALNQKWFGDSPDLEAYLKHFYRPPFRLQPEYSFPLALPHYSFSAETPESICWRRALEIAQPQLQCSLHGADTGGSFFLLSSECPDLAAQLVRLPASFGIALNEVGEFFAEMEVFEPGVFAFPSVTEIIAHDVSRGDAPGTSWTAGNSSAGFALDSLGSFSMTCEVPIWRDAREGDRSASGRTVGDVVDDQIDQLREDAEILTASLPKLHPRVESFEGQALIESLEDSLSGTIGLVSALTRARPHGADDRPLRKHDLVVAESGTYGLRTSAMLLRLATLLRDPAIEAVSRAVLDRRLSGYLRSARLSPIPLAQATGLQMAAIRAAIRFLSEGPEA
ncbi:MAG: M14 family zinc carboxypeptidase [Mycobacterium sp.]|nr:M14 family zinc carboxypeptidase [Mycobacterium sp.]